MSSNSYFSLATLKSISNNYTSNAVSVWKYSSLITGGIIFAGTIGHCLYDTITNYKKHGLSLYLKGDWTYLLRNILGINGHNSSTDIAVNTLQTELAKIKINKFNYIYSLSVIGACFGPLITLSIIHNSIHKFITNPIKKIYNKYIYENHRFERFTHRLLNAKQRLEQASRDKDAALLEQFNNRVVPESSFVEDKPTDCPICAIKLEDTDQPLSCGHYIHKECFMKTKNTICPMCRTEVKLSFDDYRELCGHKQINSNTIDISNFTVSTTTVTTTTITTSNNDNIDMNDVVMEDLDSIGSINVPITSAEHTQ